MTDTYSDEHIICPYCFKENSTDDTYESCRDTCSYCDEEFDLTVEYDPSYSTVKIDHEKEKRREDERKAQHQAEVDAAKKFTPGMRVRIRNEYRKELDGKEATVANVERKRGSPFVEIVIDGGNPDSIFGRTSARAKELEKI